MTHHTTIANWLSKHILALNKISQLIIGVLLIVFCFYQAAIFPSFSTVIVALIGSIIIVQYASAFAWLAYLPLLVIGLNFTTWSGRFVFNEFDLIILATIGTSLCFQPLNLSTLFTRKMIIPLALIILSVVSIDISSLYNAIGEPQFTNPYYTNLYHFKVAKGIIYGFALALLFNNLYQQSTAHTFRYLTYGSWLGTSILFLIILWERQTLVPLLTLQPWWAIASSLLDLTSSYRVTAMFSDMHTGGEAIDGIFLLLLAINLAGFYWLKQSTQKIIALVMLLCIAYCIVVGFTRATYVSSVLLVALFALLYRVKMQPYNPVSMMTLLAYSCLIACSFVCYHFAGYVGLMSFNLLLISGFLGHAIISLYQRPKHYLMWILLCTCAMAMFLSTHQHVNSKWITPSIFGFFMILMSLGITFILLLIISKKMRPKTGGEIAIRAAVVMTLSIVFSLVFGGYQISARVDTIGQDLSTRFDHWHKVLLSSEDNLSTKILGNGVGSFPLNYVLAHPETVSEVGSFSINENNHLVLGHGDDLAFGQRLTIHQNTDYHVKIKNLYTENASVSVFFCERNLIFASNFQAKCVAKTVALSSGETNFTLNSKSVGKYQNNLLAWPTLVYLKNTRTKKAITLTNISITTDHFSNNLIKNSDFNKGLDHWFFYNDFQHLPWHIKNIYLSTYYQIGFLGVLLITFLVGKAVLARIGNTQDIEFQLLVSVYIIGMCLFGFFGDPLDSAKASIFFYMLLFSQYFMVSTKA